MKSEYFPMLKRFFLFTALMILLAGCGSGGSGTSVSSVSPTNDTSSASSTTSTGTGSIALKLVWSANNSASQGKATAKALFLPLVVSKFKIIVSGPGISPPIESPLIDAAVGKGTVPGIPTGTDRTVTVQGLDTNNLIAYQGQLTGVTIKAGPNDDVTITMTSSSPVTSASPSGGTFDSVQNVTLTSNPAAIIYYTTNGVDVPDFTSPHGSSPVVIPIPVTTTLKFFANLTGITPEAIKTETYNLTGSLTVQVQ